MLALSSTAALRAPARAATRKAKAARRVQVVEAVGASAPPTRREAVVNALKGAALAATAAATLSMSAPALADSLPENNAVKLLCNAECEEALKEATLVTTPSGLQYKDIVVGEGAQPEPGFQVVVDYIAKNEAGLIFDNSLEKGKPNDVRVTGDPTSAIVIPGLDEGILSMKSGGVRRLFIPGELAFPKGLASAPGRPRIAPYSPVVFDVKLIYIPGLE